MSCRHGPDGGVAIPRGEARKSELCVGARRRARATPEKQAAQRGWFHVHSSGVCISLNNCECLLCLSHLLLELTTEVESDVAPLPTLAAWSTLLCPCVAPPARSLYPLPASTHACPAPAPSRSSAVQHRRGCPARLTSTRRTTGRVPSGTTGASAIGGSDAPWTAVALRVALTTPPPPRSRKCGNNHGLVRKYHMMLCRRCFRENADNIGFTKVS